jgi:ADP-ribose pyrophosphatase YjhB (NUDIX family)
MKFKNYLLSKWIKKLDKKTSLISLKHLGTITRGKKIFATFLDTYTSVKKKKIRRFILLLQPSVVIIPIIKCNNIFYTILTKQKRIFNGREILEFPAGGIDQNSSPTKAALQEIREELGIQLKKKNLKKLYDKYIILDSSSTTGKSYYFYFILNKDKNFLNLLNNKTTGNQNEGEKITLIVKRLDEVVKINNVTTVMGSLLIRNKLKLSATS